VRESWGSTKPKGTMKVKAGLFGSAQVGSVDPSLGRRRTTGPSRSHRR